MAKAICVRFCLPLLLVGMLVPTSFGQSGGASSQSDTVTVDQAKTPAPPASPPAQKPESTKFRLEAGLFYSPFVPGPGSQNWRGGDFRLLYTGSKRITPFGGFGRISNSDGSQFSYGVGSYVHFSRYFYVIGGMSAAQESGVQFFPYRRYDLAGYFSAPQVKGMIFSVGWTEMPVYRTSGGGRIISFGDIYYWRRFVFSGSLNLNFALPGNEKSLSGQFAAMYGTQKRYYVSGGMSGGGAAYMLITGAPFLVQYQVAGGFAAVTKWFAPHASINFRYDYQVFIDNNLQRHSFRTGIAYEF